MQAMKRRSRIVAGLLAAVALLFSQLVLPAQGCPRIADMNAMTHAMAIEQSSSVAMPCERHCVESVKSFDAVKPALAAPAAPMATPLRMIAAASPMHAPSRVPASEASGPAPPFLRTTVLRI